MNVLNQLQLCKEQLQKAQRLEEAQRIHLKAYRGVPYQAAPHSNPQGSFSGFYRGHAYDFDR